MNHQFTITFVLAGLWTLFWAISIMVAMSRHGKGKAILSAIFGTLLMVIIGAFFYNYVIIESIKRMMGQ